MARSKKKYPVNPLAKTMSLRARLENYHMDKDKMFRQHMDAPAEKLAEEHERIRVWWDV